MAYVFTFWVCFMLYKEYSNVAFMRLHFLASQKRRADQFTVSTLMKYILTIYKYEACSTAVVINN
jgi:hypothetical protein